jgi:hypothetical protein
MRESKSRRISAGDWNRLWAEASNQKSSPKKVSTTRRLTPFNNKNQWLTFDSDPSLVKKLVEETTKVVKPNLKHLWIGAQRIVADKKREGMCRVNPLLHVINEGQTIANV